MVPDSTCPWLYCAATATAYLLAERPLPFRSDSPKSQASSPTPLRWCRVLASATTPAALLPPPPSAPLDKESVDVKAAREALDEAMDVALENHKRCVVKADRLVAKDVELLRCVIRQAKRYLSGGSREKNIKGFLEVVVAYVMENLQD